MKIVQHCRTAILLSLLILLAITLDAQELKQGDTMPAKIFQQLNSGKKKLVILHFWNTLCKGCVQELVKIDSLQNKFDTAVQFNMIAYESSEVINDFFAVRKKLVKPKGAIYWNGDKTWRKYFPHSFVPHNVWLNKEGKVLSVTNGGQTTARAIVTYLSSGKTITTAKKKEKDINWNIPVLSQFYAAGGNDQFHSYRMHAIDNIRQTHEWKRIQGTGEVYRVIMHKVSAIDIILEAFNKGEEKFAPLYANVLLKLKPGSKYAIPADRNDREAWYKDHLLLYDMEVPQEKAEEFYSYMQQDLVKMFDLKATVIKQKRKCLVLTLSDSAKLTSNGGVPGSFPPKKAGDSLWRFTNYPFKNFLLILARYIHRNQFELRDQTGFIGNIDMLLNGQIIDKLDPRQLAADLAVYGITLTETECEADVLEITE